MEYNNSLFNSITIECSRRGGKAQGWDAEHLADDQLAEILASNEKLAALFLRTYSEKTAVDSHPKKDFFRTLHTLVERRIKELEVAGDHASEELLQVSKTTKEISQKLLWQVKPEIVADFEEQTPGKTLSLEATGLSKDAASLYERYQISEPHVLPPHSHIDPLLELFQWVLMLVDAEEPYQEDEIHSPHRELLTQLMVRITPSGQRHLHKLVELVINSSSVFALDTLAGMMSPEQMRAFSLSILARLYHSLVSQRDSLDDELLQQKKLEQAIARHSSDKAKLEENFFALSQKATNCKALIRKYSRDIMSWKDRLQHPAPLTLAELQILEGYIKNIFVERGDPNTADARQTTVNRHKKDSRKLLMLAISAADNVVEEYREQFKKFEEQLFKQNQAIMKKSEQIERWKSGLKEIDPSRSPQKLLQKTEQCREVILDKIFYADSIKYPLNIREELSIDFLSELDFHATEYSQMLEDLNPLSAVAVLSRGLKNNFEPFMMALEYITSEDYHTKIVLSVSKDNPPAEFERKTAAYDTMNVAMEGASNDEKLHAFAAMRQGLVHKIQEKYPDTWETILGELN